MASESGDKAVAQPFGWWDTLNGVLWMNEADAKSAAEGGNRIIPLYEKPVSVPAPEAPHDYKNNRNNEYNPDEVLASKLAAIEAQGERCPHGTINKEGFC